MSQIAHPILESQAGFNGGYLTTWDGRAKHGVGPGGIKYNVKVGSSCFGWPETEYLEPGVSLKEVEAKATPYQNPSSFMTTMNTVCSVGNEATLVSGDSKGKKGVIIGKTNKHILAQFPDETLEALTIGDYVRIRAEGVGLEVEGFEGSVFNMSGEFLDSLNLSLNGGILWFPVAKIIPAYAMGSGVGGSEAQRGTFSIQSNPPELVEELGIGDLRIGDIVALKDILMHYGKAYYRGAITVGVVVTGASDNAGHGPGVLALASSKSGMILPVIDRSANLIRYIR
jgi:hypothetical protein